MGNRRMISKTVTQTQRFLRLPLEAQALYFHLVQNSDDDGVVEGFPILRMIGASEDSLGLLVVKQFIKPLNDEMVYFVIDFHEQNTIQKHHYKPSRYQELLGDEEIQKNPRISKNLEAESLVKSEGYQNVNKELSESYPNISKVKLSKDNISQLKSVEENDNSDQTATADPTEKEIQDISNYYQSRIGPLDGHHFKQLMEFLTVDNMEAELLKRAIDKSADNSKRTFGYVRAILKNWVQNGIKTIAQQDEEERNYTASKNKGKVATESNSVFPDDIGI